MRQPEMTIPELRQEPFLHVPFRKGAEVRIEEAMRYNPAEVAIHGLKKHNAIDYRAPRGTPVRAAADGWAMYSYQSDPWALDDQRAERYGAPIGFGYGEFVQMVHPDADGDYSNESVYTVYAHLQRANEGLPFGWIAPDADSEGHKGFDCKGIYLPVERFVSSAIFVRRGQVIGYVGDTGLHSVPQPDSPREDALLYELPPSKYGRPRAHVQRADPDEYPSWDSPHLHFEVLTRAPDGEGKRDRIDPYGHYTVAAQPDGAPYDGPMHASRHLFVADARGHAQYAA